MTVQDEERDLLRQQQAAEDELAAVRREIAESLGKRIGLATAEVLRRRLDVAQERLREVKQAIADLNEGTSS